MKHLITLTGFILFVFSITIVAQDHDKFKALTSQGDNQIELNGEWQQIKLAKPYPDNSNVKVGENGYLVLSHSKGSSIVLEEEGNYLVKEIFSKKSKKTSGLMSKFADYLSKQVVASSDLENTIPGSVERSVSTIRVVQPRNTFLMNEDITFSWEDESDTEGNYVLEISNRFGDVLFTDTLETTSHTMDINPLEFKNNECYYWSVRKLDTNFAKSEEYCIKQLDGEKRAAIQDTLETIESDIGNTAFGNIVTASFLERNELNYYADKYYLQAIQSKPEIVSYKNLYRRFLLKRGLIEKAEQLKQ